MKQVFNIFSTKKLVLTFIFLLSIVASLLGIGATYVHGIFIDTLIEAESVQDMYYIIIIFGFITALAILLQFTASMIISPLKEKLIFFYKMQIFNYDNIYSKEKDVIYFSKRIEDDTRQIVNFFVDNYSTAIIKIVELVTISILIFSINLYVGITMIIVCPIYITLYVLFRKSIFNRSLQTREKSAGFFSDCANYLKKESSINYLQESFLSYLKKYKDYVFIRSIFDSTQGFIVGTVQIIVFFVGGISVINGNTTIGLLSVLMMYFNQVIGNMSYYLELGRKWQVTKSSLYRIKEIKNKETAV
ncbi:MAG: ABC transporter transmembrane domain-containing protein [Defluviitaleaceae bacterium]|nr:ABC transporter transmembrane domain-containing protein [Defluviitaleaceae bacterium]